MLWRIDSGVMEGVTIRLLTIGALRKFKEHAPKTVLTCIDGKQVRAIDCDEDVRGDFVAYGFIVNDRFPF